MAHPLLIGGLAIGGLLLLDPTVTKSAGSGLTYLSDFMRARGQVGGVSFILPTSASAVETFQAMRDAQTGAWGTSGGYPKAPSEDELRDTAQAWLDAYAGACGQNSGAVTGSVFDSSAFNLSMLVQRLGGSAVPATCSTDACDDPTLSKTLSPLGKAVCALKATITTFGDPDVAQVYAKIEALATELDAADYTIPGNRASDSLASLTDLPAELVSYVADKFLGSPIVWAGGLAFAAYLVLK